MQAHLYYVHVFAILNDDDDDDDDHDHDNHCANHSDCVNHHDNPSLQLDFDLLHNAIFSIVRTFLSVSPPLPKQDILRVRIWNSSSTHRAAAQAAEAGHASRRSGEFGRRVAQPRG